MVRYISAARYAARHGCPEVTRLVRRVNEQNETVRAVSDTVLDIKETVDQQTETLAVIQETQAQHGELLAEILRRLSNNTSD